MAELSEAQIELVSAYIKQNGVAQDELHDDLLDHVCTSIELRIQQGESFDQAFQYTIKLFGPGGLKQVQLETFELLTEMNETMKKVTFGFGLTSTFLLLAGTIFKLMHWPGANVMFMLGAVILALIYLPLILWHKLKESPGNEALMHISGFVGLAFTTVGSLFKIMHWPGASVLLLIGMGTLAFIYVPIYFYKKYRVSANKPITFSASLVAMTCLILVFALTRVNNSKNYDYGLTLIDSQLRTSVENTSNNNLLYAELENESRASEIRNAASNAINQLRLTRATIIASVDNISIDEAASLKLSEVRNSSDFKTPTDILFNAADGESVSIQTLVNELNMFKGVVVETYSPNLQKQVEATFPFNTNATFTEDGEQIIWAEFSFYKVPVIGVLSNLSKLESEIKQAENQALIYLISRPEASNPPS
jgi:hypothetical protein